ncbi:hypothetical protein [Frankia sp. AgKG'84/4]|uniref:hypothetical protein n=1 Tax=Frankia sp. AgKG'84/4 TaxID=573490 RepID=UPI00200DA3BF|nr:hypothetical protein [Frankia sp. AgKG'84/4]MCL9793872.1 hypothetical protein [Frankia sp. AgKG'84/4]
MIEHPRTARGGLSAWLALAECLDLWETSDVVGATVALLARPSNRILTSDPEALTRLDQARDVPAMVVRC